jgi:hypothetical protein
MRCPAKHILRFGAPFARTAALMLVVAALASGCSSLGSAAASRFADGLSESILDADDPETVREGIPAYLLLLDAMVRSDPGNERFLGAAAQLYAAYGLVFVTDPARASTLAIRAREYGNRGVCVTDRRACGSDALDYEAFTAVIDDLDRDDVAALYSYCVGELAYLRTHSDDWTAIARLPKIEYALKHLLALGNAPEAVNINMYLGVLNTLRPAALGGRPDDAKTYFEEAVRLSDGLNLAVKTEYARSYARLVYDRDLHDRLLNEVLQAPARQPGMTLFNTLAQQQARSLLATADEYF